jgi:hypothetical protein
MRLPTSAGIDASLDRDDLPLDPLLDLANLAGDPRGHRTLQVVSVVIAISYSLVAENDRSRHLDELAGRTGKENVTFVAELSQRSSTRLAPSGGQ